jgi:hypothetical protein
MLFCIGAYIYKKKRKGSNTPHTPNVTEEKGVQVEEVPKEAPQKETVSIDSDVVHIRSVEEVSDVKNVFRKFRSIAHS